MDEEKKQGEGLEGQKGNNSGKGPSSGKGKEMPRTLSKVQAEYDEVCKKKRELAAELNKLKQE